MARADRIAFVCPRFAEGSTVGGAETLLRELARHAGRAGRSVTFLATCATNHFTWANERPPGPQRLDGLDVLFFPVDEGRDVGAFLGAQEALSRGRGVEPEVEDAWLRNGVQSSALCDHLRRQPYDRIVTGPYLFGLVVAASRIAPDRTILTPCLHDEPFARVEAIREMFGSVRGVMFNSEPERELARALYGLDERRGTVVGMGIDPFEADPSAFARRRGIGYPYVMYAGRREPLKGTPLLIDYLSAFRARTGRRVRLVLAGSGAVDLPGDAAQWIDDAGFLPEIEKREAMAGATAFCHPSVLESLGIVVLEAWMARTAALVHGNCAVLRDHCRRSNGGLWFTGYPEFEESLLLLLDREDVRRAMAGNGRSYVEERYAWAAVEPRLMDALDR